MTFRSLVLPAALGLSLLGCGAGPPPDEVARVLQSRLAGPRAVRSEILIEPKALERFYSARQYRPAWSAGQASQIVRAIEGVAADGLTPAHYHLEAIRDLMRGGADPTSAEEAADLELLLSDAAAAMIDHLRYGKVTPSTLEPAWNVDPRKGAPPLAEELAKVAGSGSPAEAIEANRPRHFIY